MAIKLYKSQVAPQSYIRSRAAVQGAPMRVGSAKDDLITQGLDTASTIAIAEQERKTATDIVAAENEYRDELLKYETDYKNTKKRANARTSQDDFAKENERLKAKYSDRFTGNARGQRIWEQTASQIRMSSLSRGIAHANKEEDLYRQETTAGAIATYTQKVSAQNGNEQAINNLRAQLNARLKAVNPDVDLTAMMAKIDLQTATTRINTAVAQKDHVEAKRLLKDYKSVLGASYDDMVNSVESSRRVAAKESGSQYAIEAYNDKIPAEKVWSDIAKIKDEDERNAAQRQYSTMWTMQKQIDDRFVQDGSVEVYNSIAEMPVNDLATHQAYVDSLPERTEAQRKIKKYGQSLADARKSGIGVDKLSDGAAYVDLRSDILRGVITTPEQIRSDLRATKLTENDINDQVDLLKASQMATDKSINDSFKAAYGADTWKNLNKNTQFKLIQQVKTRVKETNRGQDTGYIQTVVDSLAMKGEAKNRWFPGYGKNTELGKMLIDNDLDPNELMDSLNKGESLFLPSDIPEDFTEEWNNGTIPSKKQWESLYSGDKAKKAAYLRWMMDNTGPRQ